MTDALFRASLKERGRWTNSAAAKTTFSTSATSGKVMSPSGHTDGETTNRLVAACSMIAKSTLPCVPRNT